MGLKTLLKELWKALDEIPNCPACNGTGLPTVPAWAELVWWRGALVSVCHQCKGTGKL